MDFLNGVLDWLSGVFSSKESGKQKPAQKKERYVPRYEKKSYEGRNRPDLNNMPEELVKFMIKWFLYSGMSLEGAAATIGNLWRESYLNPAQVQLSDEGKLTGPGRGLAQWTDTTMTSTKKDDGLMRWDIYKNEFFPMLKRSNPFWASHKLEDLEPQLAYIVFELRKHYARVWREMETRGSVSSKAILFMKVYEVSANRDEKPEQNLRSNLAEKAYMIGKGDKEIMRIVASMKDAPKAQEPKEKPKEPAQKKKVPSQKKPTAAPKKPGVKPKKTAATSKKTSPSQKKGPKKVVAPKKKGKVVPPKRRGR
jgi:hypothetical protein